MGESSNNSDRVINLIYADVGQGAVCVEIPSRKIIRRLCRVESKYKQWQQESKKGWGKNWTNDDAHLTVQKCMNAGKKYFEARASLHDVIGEVMTTHGKGYKVQSESCYVCVNHASMDC